MYTLAVMCIALTRHRPSCTQLFFSAAVTRSVVLMYARRVSVSNHSSSRYDFMPATMPGGGVRAQAVSLGRGVPVGQRAVRRVEVAGRRHVAEVGHAAGVQARVA